MQKPLPLREGARVAAVAPAGPFDRQLFEAGAAILRQRYDVVHTEALFARTRFLAGNDDHRLADLMRALSDPEIAGVFAARGGYGSMRLLPRISPDRLPPRVLVGFSDITALHLAWQAAGRVSVHGPVLTQLGRLGRDDVARLFEVLEADGPASPLSGTRTIVPGSVEGTLIGGNLSMLTRLLGTPYLPSLSGAVLLLEDVGERPYRLDRMWTHLRLAGAFRELAGICLGDFTECEETEAEFRSEDVLRDCAGETGLPCAAGFPIGHGAVNRAVPLGCRVRLDADAKTLTFLEPHTAPAEGQG